MRHLSVTAGQLLFPSCGIVRGTYAAPCGICGTTSLGWEHFRWSPDVCGAPHGYRMVPHSVRRHPWEGVERVVLCTPDRVAVET